jgi:carboxypeptidase Taq
MQKTPFPTMTTFESLTEQLLKVAHLKSALSTLHWDQEVMMPHGAANLKAGHIATLSGFLHTQFIDQCGPLIDRLAHQQEELDSFQQLNLGRLQYDLEKTRKLPTAHVIELSQATSKALHAWVSARKSADFSAFAPHLSKLIDLKIQEADYLGFSENPYDALIDQYEPHMRFSQVKAVFEPFKAELRDLLTQIHACPQVQDGFLAQPIFPQEQLQWTEVVLKAMGYDFDRGRQDISTHPFTIGIDPSDVRITTRVDPHDIREALYSSIHEGGHALYEQGLPIAHFGLPAAEACSLSIHESQSRLWENNIARSLPFWEHFFPQLAAMYPDQLIGKSPVDLFKAVNLVTPSLIRISSDELSYHFHIILRSELENELINRRLKVADLPEAWNEKVKTYLGLDVPDDSQGVLQDIHWSHGSFGYFPTYSLGSFYAAQLMDSAITALPNLESEIKNGDFTQLKSWLNREIHAHGRLYSAEELCKRVSGKPLDVQHFIRYAKAKYSKVYNIQLN